MSLPSNYKQIAAGAPSGPPTPSSSSSRSRGSGGDRNKDTTPIFTHSNYGNPAFTPQKAGKSSSSKNQSDSRAPKPPKAPEKPMLPYMRYSKRIWDSVKAQNPDLKLWELGKKIGAMWKQLNETEKQEYIDEYEADKAEYEKSLKAYHNSPPYLAYMAAKSKVKTDADVHETPSRSGGKSQQERRIDIQPAEDEDDQDECGYSFKHVAYARYLRNHRLINEIFSDAVVPDVRSVVTTQRMQVLKRQVSSLTMHQTKLEAELQQMEEKFEAKKQRMVESSEAFQEDLKRHCKPAVDEDTFQKMVQRMYEEMKRDRQRMEDPSVAASHAAAAAAAAAAAHAAAVHRAEEKPPTGPHVAAAASAVGKKEPSTTTTLAKPPTHESSSKTDPEPMDIEPTPKPSVPPMPPKSEVRANDVPKPSQKSGMDSGKEAPKLPNAAVPKPHNAKTPTPIATAPNTEQQQQPPQQQPQPGMPPANPNAPNPPTMAMHTHHPTHPHLPHLPPHQGMYNYGAPPRSPYYQPQYGAHPTQPYGQYAPYSHYQQPYGPPPGTHYMNTRPPPQHYPEHAPPGQQTPHDIYGQTSAAHNAAAQQQQQAAPTAPATAPGAVAANAASNAAAVTDAAKSDVEHKKDSE